MADKRLIDANALDVIRFIPTGGEPLTAGERGWNECISFLQTKSKTIDAVEVVRCRECKESDYYSADDPDGLYCGVWDTVVRCNGYCDHGAKMDAKDIDVHTKDGGEPDGNQH